MAIVPKKSDPTSLQVNRHHHKKTRSSYYKKPISSGDLPTSLSRIAQEAFDAHQKQNRAWLHNQMDMPGNNGISSYQHKELKDWFSIRTLKERARAPLAKDGVRLSQPSQAHIARLERERNAEREKQGVPGDWSPVGNWWQDASGQAEDDGKKKGKTKRRQRSKKHGLQDNRQARRIRAFMERKDKEREEKEAEARLVAMRKGIGKMHIEDQDEEDMASEEGEEESCGEEMVIENLNEEEEQKMDLRRWTEELPIRGVRP
ncbi:hypothetical protein G7Y79_00004g013710 [Physcia stellaris]|nr:hypothetical protein G7Y79_00004g013710 [Physcia stellaris]